MPSVDVMHVCYGGMGGHQSVVNTLTAQFNRLGIATGVLAIAPATALSSDRDVWTGATAVAQIPLTRNRDFHSMVTTFRAARSMTARVVVMHTHRHATPVALARVASGQRLHMVTAEHSSLPSRDVATNVNSASSLVWSKKVVFLTHENLAGYPLRRLPLPALAAPAVIANGVDMSTFARAPRSRSKERAVVGMASRFASSKDFDTLIAAMVLLAERHGPRHAPILKLAGDGPELARIQTLAKTSGVADVVEFLGGLPSHQMPEFFESLDVYVQSTFGETLSMSLLQAAAVGVPIVATKVAGVADLFTDRQFALLVSPRDPVGLADAVDAVITSPSLAHGLADRAHQMVATNYEASVMAQSYVRMFAEIDSAGPWVAALDQFPAESAT